MLYMRQEAGEQTVHIPNNGVGAAEGEFYFTLRGTAGRRYEMSGTAVSVKGAPRNFWRLRVSVPDGIPAGEYEYVLTRSGVELSRGLAMLGRPERSQTYDKTIEYEQYDG